MAVQSPSPKASARPRTIRGLDAEQRRSQRRAQLLSAMFDLVAIHGYPNTSIEQICQRAYVGNKAFYELFDSKEDCYLALLQQVSEQIFGRVADVVEQSTDDLPELERRALAAFAHALVDDPRVAVVTFGEAAGISPNVERQRRKNRRQAAALLETVWRRPDCHALAIATIGGLFDTVADWLQDTDEQHPRTIDALIADLTTFVAVIRAGMAAQAT
jgi:AcrR family transcriptional regulator